MNQTISQPNKQLADNAPRIINFRIDVEKIGLLIGPGGKTIKGISEKFDVTTNVDNDGTVTIYSLDKAAAENAKQAFLALMQEPEIGRVYPGVVKRIMDFGAFIEFLPGKEGLCHISKLSAQRVNTVNEVVQLNQEVKVKVLEIDKMGRVNLSMVFDGDSKPD